MTRDGLVMGVTHLNGFSASSSGFGDTCTNASVLPDGTQASVNSRQRLSTFCKHPEFREQTDATSASQAVPVTMAEPELSPAADPSLRSPRSAPLSLSLSFPFLREGSRVWERAALQPGELPSPLPTKRTRTYSATVRANAGPVFKGVCKNFSRSQGHGYIRPAHGGEDIFVHISDIEGEYVPVEGDEVTYKVCAILPRT
ncbi:hypothetical protein G5714_003944 [Onychostoma macrolepis]|uniref:CSD domain-containing protein n=1 Tax=Onychostoma macrolepis TaxID=369639 RepID=A0A7J6DBR6_9TELE|nr:hypothetical protein G5714_003944 [Onychostoma macrolepis]